MDLLIQPYEAMGPVRFGMRRDEVRAAIGTKVSPFMKGLDSTTLTDSFDDERIHVYYDEQDCCEAVEVASPSVPLLEGQALLGRPFSEVRDWLMSRDSEVELDGAGLIAFTLGVGLYAPSALKEPDEPVEGVIAFRRGYYD